MSLHEWPLTAYQRDVWTAAALNPESNQFTVSMWEKIDGDIDTDLLVRITKSVVRRNPCWRIRMNERDGVPYQWLSDTIPEVSVLDFSSEPDPAAACASWLKEASSGVFAITDSPLSKFAVLIESPTVTYWYGSGHHITSDGWTGRLLARQIFDEYARVAGEGESLDTGDSPSYLDFVAEEESYRASNRWSEDREFHHKQFSSTPPVLFSRTAPEERRSGATHVFSLDKSIMNRIRKERKVFPYLFAALGTYLTRIHRTEDVLIGIPLLNRNARQRNIHGQFSNTLPLRFSSASEGFSLQDHVTSIGDSLISLMRHSKIALGDVLQAMPGVRSGSRQLFDVTLSYLTADPVKVLPGAVSELTMTTQAHVHDALNICIYDSGEESDVRIVFDYAEDVFDENYPISSVAEHFKNLLVNGLQNSDVPWSAVDMLAPAERDELTHMMSRGPVVPYPDQATLHGLFEIQARTRPSETAVVDAFTGQSLTYAELNADANRVARTLRAEGVGRDDRVAVLMERGPLLLVALLGVLKAGSAYVPVDPGYPAERVKLLLADSRAKVVLVDEQMPERLAGTESVVRSIRDILQAEASGEPVDSLATSKDLAYVIYTSGSTGRPKGVMVEHHSVVNRLAWMQRAYPIDQGDILLQKTPVSFDVSVWELFWWAIQGAKLVLLPRDGQKDPKEILQTIRQHGVSTIHFVPSMLGPFLELLEDFPNLVEETSSLRYVFCSGEALPPARVEQFNTIFSSSTKRPALVNLYGPTEATVDVSCYECPADSGPVRRVPIGRPIDNTQLYVLGSRDELQPVGVPGELCIGGVQVARGYLDRPELTAEKFVDDPFTQGGRLYRTGDLARWLSDGTLEYLGRIDGQVKIRGNRVETGEVASALSSLTNVRDAVVVGRTLPGRSTHLVGYYEASSEIEAAEIRAHLAGSLPEFMIPTFFQRVERIPLTPNGKADVRALAELGSAVEADASGDPRNAAEAVLAEIWADVLQTERVGVHDDYFALGGDSILMLRVRALAEKRGLFFSLSDLVQNPTVAALARKARAVEGDSESALEPFDLVTDLDRAALGDAEDAFPLSRLQLGLLYHSRRHENSAMYKDVFRYTLAMPWDEPAFRVAVSRLVARHPVLRSSFDLASHSEPMQVIHPAVSGEFEVVDLRSHSDTEAESAVADHMEERRFHDYVFEQAPLYHLRVFVRPATVDLVLSFHHALLDGGSVANLLREVLQDYAHALGLGIDPVPTLALPSPALHIRNERQAADSDRTRRYWQERLAGAKVLHIDALAPYQTHPGNAAQIVRDVELPADLSARLRQVAGEHTLPLKSLLFAAHSLTLRMLTGTDDITTGMVTHGRPEQQDAERIAGLFLNTLPVRLNAAGESWIAVAREAFRQEQELHPHRLYPLSTIQEDFGTQVIETAFNHVHFHQLTQVMDLPDIELVDFRTREETNFALLVNSFIDPLSQNIHLRIDCDGSIFSPDQADVLARSLTQILHRMAEHPNETPDYTFLTTPPTYQDIASFFQRVERIPLTPNGKADVRALAELGSAVEADASGDPRNAAEAVLAEIWADVLQTERVGVHDDYFALGGDSILMLRVRALAEKRGLFFSLSDLVQNPTVAALARKARAVEGDSESALEPFDLVTDLDRAALGDAEDAFPLSRLQLGLLYHSRRHENSAMYKDVFRYTLAMPWDEPAFRVAVSRLVARHPVLRSSFDLASHSEPMQVIHPAVSGEFEVVDLRSHSDTEAESAVADHMEERRFHDYVFEQAPLYHLRVFVRPATVDLVLSFHHALLDGGSVANLLREVLQDYAHALGLGIDPVPTLALPSPALHIRNERQAADSDRTRRYWQERLAGAKVLHIDALAPYQTHPGNAAQIVRDVELPADLSARLRQVAGEHTLPLKSLLFAAHSLTLRMLTGTDDITTGMVTHGRPEQQDAERIAGLFLNTLPVRLNAAGESWIAVAREAFRQEQELHPHRLYPLSTIQEDFGTQVIETAFNHVHFHQLTQVMDLPDIELVDFRTREETNFALLVNSFIDPLSQNIHLRIDCDGSIFSPDQADVLARSLTQILHRMAEHPNETPDYTFLTTPPTYQDKSTEGASSVVERFFDVAARSPEAIALAMHERRWTYEQLADAARNVAQRLIETGTQPGARIGVAMDRSPEAIATILGTLMARAAVVPMDTDYPAERLVAMARQANVFRIITDEQHAHLAGDPELLLPAESITASTSMVRALLPPEPESTAYVLFTSGSTGTPKGVAMPHRALANLIAWQNRASSGGSTGGDTLQYAPVSFDVSFQEIFSTLCAGNTLHLVSEAERRDFPGLLRTIDAAGIERIYMPYVALQQLASTAVALDIAPKSLRVIISSGEQLRVTDEIRRFLGRLPGVLLENQYGPTETHVATRFTMTGDPADYPLLPPIGQPIDGEAVYVLDDRLQPVPPGVKGEIFVGGAGLAQGYEGRPDLTKERFLDRPFGPEGELIYRTGDLGVALPSGEIICLGRTDAQVKVRGFRVEPAEVELAITALAGKYPGIEGAAVVARHREGNDTFLAAFLLGDSAEVDLDDLKRELRAKLPDYMVPSQFAWLPGFPLTPSGKRDDEALRRIPLNAVPSGQFTAPRDEYERILADILGDLLQIPSVGVHDDFFELGGTSLTVMRLMMLIEQRYGPVIQLQDVIAEPTVEALAARLRRGNAVYAYDPLVAISPNGAKRPIFLVHPMGGNVLCYVRLARKFPGDQPLYALQAAGSTPGSEPVRTMPELVSSYISAIRRVQPHGPYTLGGWSFGGFVAFEMARQLKEQGEEVADLVLLDTTAARGKRVGGDDEDLLRWFFWELLLQKRGASSTMDHLPEELDTVDKKFDYMAGVAQELGVLPAGSSGAVVRRLFGVYAANWDLAINYFPDVAEFDLTLIRAEEPLPQSLRSMHDSMGSQYDDPTNGWSHMTKGRINVVTVPGNHLSIVEEPYVGKVAEAIYAAMGHRSIAGEIEGE
ncbi:amino acid adenylation domain-containing protein [Streptomyces sp. CGMCC 4.7035]|uniref:non-ribosomal peptide synthetase n=1 Tax=Streptomyces sp. CGMCC 4.7035 TaxID=3061628 RepID=UPI002873657A|nr:non-ribosomal peptide synthetase [Streptomyces sp. CGMCC 4.7035]WNC02457.1 amino acid adenylation domain-containing protein [Streptomyces sp. CGMCC 4.7035]